MTAKPTKLYPIAGRFLSDVPHSVHVAPTKEAADNLIASGAFTANPKHPERDHDAPDLGKAPVETFRTRFQGEDPDEVPAVIAEAEPPPETPTPTAPQDAAPSDTQAEE